jgi:type III restriction enzyme
MRVPTPIVDEDALEQIASVLDLRAPNRDAILSVAHHLSSAEPGFEGVLDLATGLGKTYVAAGLIDYLVETAGVRNFAIITPGRTILNKTIDNFTPGARKSLVGKMTTRPRVITAAGFETADVRRVLDDPEEVKLFVFTVQSLTGVDKTQRRKLHDYQEELGGPLYDHLRKLDDLVVLADEHHCYYGLAFSKAIRELDPYALIGLTATPHAKTPDEQIVYRYPLAHAIAAKYVKTPVIVGRTDDRADVETKLRDGLTLLHAKGAALERYCAAEGVTRVTPIMLVVAPTIDEAIEVETILADLTFHGGRYADVVLRIDSSSPDDSLAALTTVEDAGSPVRIIVSVGMLNDGWDVANVYVIVSLRPSISQILTEQTLGRGLRLPFGHYTDIELLDTLEVVAHERFEELLRQAKVLKQKVIDWRSILAAGLTDPAPEPGDTSTPEVSTPVVTGGPTHTGFEDTSELELVIAEPGEQRPITTTDTITAATVEDRTRQVEEEAALVSQLLPRHEWTPVTIPVLESVPVPPQFSLLDIVDMEPFRSYGRQLAHSPSDELRRSVMTATMRTGPSGVPEVVVGVRAATDRIYSQGTLLQPEEARIALLQRLVASPQVPSTANQYEAAEAIVDAFLVGIGDGVQHLGAWLDQAAGGLVALVQQRMRAHVGPVQLSQTVQTTSFAKVRTGRVAHSNDLQGEFKKGVGYQGFTKSLYAEDWFDSRPERDLANILDGPDDVTFWLRLQRGDLTILWRGQGTWYNPDFFVTETDGGHWVVEVKADRDMETVDVQEKKNAALRWARRVNASKVAGKWRYLLVSETQLKAATGDWRRLKALYTGE